VGNNPINANDPSGHVACRTAEECGDMGTSPNGGGLLGGGNSSNVVDNPDDELSTDSGGTPPSVGVPDLLLMNGLGNNSCNDSTCSTPPPCVNSYYAYYACDNHNPKNTRSPDYIVLNVGGSIPGLGTLISGQVSVVVDRFGNLYFGPGLAIGPEAPLGFSASLSAGYVENIHNAVKAEGIQDPLGEQQMENLFSGKYVNGSICIIFCAGVSGSPGNPNVGVEVLGIGVPQASVGGGYSFLIDLTSDTGEPLWAP